jgi:hypothetical protein
MKGYLSRLAKQSGLPFAEPHVEARAPVSGDGSGDPLAPDIEQTFMVSPELPAPERAGPAGERAEDRARASQDPAGHERPDPAAGRRTIPAAINKGDEMGRSPPRGLTPVVDDPGASRVIGHSAAPRNVDAATFEDAGPAEPAGRRARGLAHREQFETQASRNAAAPDSESKEYFARTAQILDNKESVAPELQTIVFREVQEWVAASPAESPAALEDPWPRDAGRMAKPVQARAPEFATTHEREAVPVPGQPRPLEQSVDLSIGTINVTIEEPETPRAPDPRTRPTNPAAPGDESRSSRLRRSYL